MSTITVSDTDLKRLKVILAALKKGKWELEGEEVLAFAQAFSWAAETHDKVMASLQPKKVEPSPGIEIPPGKIKRSKR